MVLCKSEQTCLIILICSLWLYLFITNVIWLLAARIFRSFAAPKQFGLRKVIPSGSPVTYRSSGYIWNLEYGTLAGSGRPRASPRTRKIWLDITDHYEFCNLWFVYIFSQRNLCRLPSQLIVNEMVSKSVTHCTWSWTGSRLAFAAEGSSLRCLLGKGRTITPTAYNIWRQTWVIVQNWVLPSTALLSPCGVDFGVKSSAEIQTEWRYHQCSTWEVFLCVWSKTHELCTLCWRCFDDSTHLCFTPVTICVMQTST